LPKKNKKKTKKKLREEDSTPKGVGVGEERPQRTSTLKNCRRANPDSERYVGEATPPLLQSEMQQAQ